jgi:spermidine/putrescine transport system substrate-binding protein
VGVRADHVSARREFLRAAAKLSAGATLAVPILGMLGSCSTADPYPRAADLRFPRPSDPVRWNLYPENPPIASGRPIEKDGVLEIFSWDSYLSPPLIRQFQKDFDVKVEVSTFAGMPEALSKLRAGAVHPDLFFPTLDVLGRSVAAELLQPLNHDYLTNFGNVWKELRNPFYDRGSQYTVPYSVYSTGIAWRNDLVHDDIPNMDNPWSVVGDTQYGSHIYILDDYREALGLMLLEQGGDDLNTEDASQITAAQERLIEISQQVNIKYSIDDYTLVAEGQAWIHQAWSGDMVTSPYYIPGTKNFDSIVAAAPIISYWFPSDDRGEVTNDVMAIPRTAAHPVLAHTFINYLLEPDNAQANFDWVGYQQPLESLTLNAVVDSYPWLAEDNLKDCLVSKDAIANGYRSLELSPEADLLWQQAWLKFQSHG